LFERVADTVPDREAVVCGERRSTYRDLDERATRLANGLAGLGVAAGEHVGLLAYDTTEHVEAMLACFKLRAVPVNVNWRYAGEELAYLFDDAGLVALVFDPQLRPDVGTPKIVVEIGDDYEALVARSSPTPDFDTRSPDDRYVLYTGGTTGLPKGVVWRQEDIFFAVLGGGNPGGPPIERPEDISRTVVEKPALRLQTFLPPGDPGPQQFVQLALGPLMHAGGQWSTLGTLLGGGKVVLHPHQHMDLARVLDLVERERVISLNLVGDAHAVPLLEVLRANAGRWDTSSLRLLGSGGSMLSGHAKEGLLAALPTVLAISEAVGSSEAPVEAISITTRAAAPTPSLHFTARPESAVLDEELQPVEPGSGAVGRLATRGRVPVGYHNDPAKSASTFVDIDGERWSVTGDMAVVEADGTIRLLGRGSMCINTGGEKVYPEEVESVLKTHPDVADVLVVGRADERFGEQVAALVEARDGGTAPSLDALQAHCRGRLAGYKLPRALYPVAHIERSPSGKPDYAWAREVVGT
jgi:acyl-CoA synthetase (AMP-forming)/AMP-acid ligase II